MPLFRYVSSRFFLYDPPGDGDFLGVDTDIPDAVYREEEELAEEVPKVNPWVCLALLIVTVAIMAITASFVRVSLQFGIIRRI